MHGVKKINKSLINHKSRYLQTSKKLHWHSDNKKERGKVGGFIPFDKPERENACSGIVLL